MDPALHSPNLSTLKCLGFFDSKPETQRPEGEQNSTQFRVTKKQMYRTKCQVIRRYPRLLVTFDLTGDDLEFDE